MSADRSWLRVFEGIPEYTDRHTSPLFSVRELPDALRGRLAVRKQRGNVKIPVGALKAIAARIEAQSNEIARLQGLGPVIDDERLAAEEERIASLRSGIHAVDTEAGEAAVYAASGALMFSGLIDFVAERIQEQSWVVTEFTAPGFLDHEDRQIWPTYLPEFRTDFGRYLRDRRAAEIAAAREEAELERELRTDNPA